MWKEFSREEERIVVPNPETWYHPSWEGRTFNYQQVLISPSSDLEPIAKRLYIEAPSALPIHLFPRSLLCGGASGHKFVGYTE